MAKDVVIIDNSLKVKAAINEATIAWLKTWSSEIESQAKRNCKLDGKAGQRLKGSYKSVVDESKGEAQIGSPLESAFWEEYGTGEYAAHGDGRKDWWVYVEDQASVAGGGKHYRQNVAEAVAASMRAKGLNAHATNGRQPSYTLEKSFESVAPKAKEDLKKVLSERLGK